MRFSFLHRSAAVFAAVLAVFFTGCTAIDEDIPAYYETAEDTKLPYPVTIGSLIFNSSPENTASLSPAVTEIICELGYEDLLIGRSVYCDYPESVQSVDTIGSAANPDADAIIAKAPQLLISQSPIAKKDITAIENTGTRVLIISAPSSVDDLYSLYKNIYRVFNGETDEEDEVVSGYMQPLENIFEQNKDILESYVYILSSDLAIASDKTFAGDFFSHFGKNLAAEKEDNAITSEELSELDPKYIILHSGMTESDLPDELSELSAIKEGRIIILSSEASELLERPTSRVYLAADHLTESIKELSSYDDQ